MPNYGDAELRNSYFKPPILRAALRSSGASGQWQDRDAEAVILRKPCVPTTEAQKKCRVLADDLPRRYLTITGNGLDKPPRAARLAAEGQAQRRRLVEERALPDDKVPGVNPFMAGLVCRCPLSELIASHCT